MHEMSQQLHDEQRVAAEHARFKQAEKGAQWVTISNADARKVLPEASHLEVVGHASPSMLVLRSYNGRVQITIDGTYPITVVTIQALALPEIINHEESK